MTWNTPASDVRESILAAISVDILEAKGSNVDRLGATDADQSDTPGKAGGLISVTAPRAGVLAESV